MGTGQPLARSTVAKIPEIGVIQLRAYHREIPCESSSVIGKGGRKNLACGVSDGEFIEPHFKIGV